MIFGESLTDEMAVARLPEYKSPPVVETAFGIEFAPLPGWNLAHFGALWQEYRETYPRAEVVPALSVSGELEITNPPIRFFLSSADGTQLVQLKTGAFVRNWRARPDNEEYPRYRTTRPSFEADLSVFLRFLTENGFPPPEVWKCEVTYVNHFLRGREWSEASDLFKILPAFTSPHLSPLLSNLTQVRFALNYELEGVGDLLVQLTPGLTLDGGELLQLTLTAYGIPKSSNLPDLMTWMDRGRFAVVQVFTDFTSKQAQSDLWGRIWS
jgi:uncharacterized protein (TIGR04255 family)